MTEDELRFELMASRKLLYRLEGKLNRLLGAIQTIADSGITPTSSYAKDILQYEKYADDEYNNPYIEKYR